MRPAPPPGDAKSSKVDNHAKVAALMSSRAWIPAIVLVSAVGCRDRAVPSGSGADAAAGVDAAVQTPVDAQADASDATTLEPPVKHSEHCPAGMLEVQGKYCTALMHRCIKGGKTLEGKKTDYPDPYYCDEYKEGQVKCLGKNQDKHFCIDEYEYPNRKGAIPVVMVSWYESKKLCEDQGKRLCGDDEWTLACEGPEHLPYTYGWKRDRTACNIDKTWIQPNDGVLAIKDGGADKIAAEIDRLSQRVPSGSMPACKSPYGVMDMGGNVDEWAVNVTLGGKPYMSIFKGGHWCSGARNRCRPVTESHDETTAYYAEGFRCCANPT